MRTGERRQQAGIAYLALLLAIALLGIAASNAVSLGAVFARREAEQHLLEVGQEFQTALRSYAGGQGPVAGVSRGPKALEDLLKDPRVPGIRRHLRSIYADPLTGKHEWGLIKDSTGSIVGVYSLAAGKPIQQDGFDDRLASFKDADSYQKWIFGLPIAGHVPASSPAQSSSALTR
jgi:type II secretory pathway pseudopilin PulG